MATVNHYTPEQRKAQAERLGKVFDLPDPGMKISEFGWSMEQAGEAVMLKVELSAFITMDEANKIINAVPIEEGTE